MDTTKTLVTSALRFFTGTALSRIAGMIRDVLMAAAFGSHPSVSAFLMAFRFANLPRRLLAEGAMQSALIPRLEAVRVQQPARAAALIRDLGLSIGIFLGIGILIAQAILHGVAHCVPASVREIVQLTSRILPSILFIAWFGMCSAVLQCTQRFFVCGMAPMMFNTVWIGAIAILWGVPCSQAMSWLSLAIVLAFAVQWLVTLPQTLQVFRGAMTSQFWRQARPFSADVRILIRPVALGVAGVGAQQIVCALDAIFARLADPTGPVYLWYALRLQQLPLALFGLAIAGAVVPPLARAVKTGDSNRYQTLLAFALTKGGILMMACTLAIITVGPSAVNLLFGRGAFSPDAVWDTARALTYYGCALVPMTWTFVLAGACYAHEEYRLPALISGVTVGFNIILDFVFVVVLGMSVQAVPIGTALSSWMQAGILLWLVIKRYGGVNLRQLAHTIGRALLAGCMAWVIVRWIQRPDLPREFWKQLQEFSIQATTFVVAWTSSMFLLGERLSRLGRMGQKVTDHGNIDR